MEFNRKLVTTAPLCERYKGYLLKMFITFFIIAFMISISVIRTYAAEPNIAQSKASYNYSYEELHFMAQVVYNEANAESEDGKKAVASVILNRFFTNNVEFSNKNYSSIISVIEEPNQFAGYPKRSDNLLEKTGCYDAVKAAIDGDDPTVCSDIPGGALFFNAEWKLGNWGVKKLFVNSKGVSVMLIDHQGYYDTY